MTEPTSTEAKPTRAYVIHPDLASRTQRREPEHALAEAVALAHALPGIEIVGDEVARLRKPDPGRLFGKGKLAEIGERLKAAEVDLVCVAVPSMRPVRVPAAVRAALDAGHGDVAHAQRLHGQLGDLRATDVGL